VVHLDGGYFPAKYDRENRQDKRTEFEEVGHFYKSDYQGTRGLPSTLKTNQRERVPGYADRLDLTFSGLSGNMVQVVHDIAFDEFVQNTGRLFLNEDFKRIAITYAGTERYKAMKDWLWSVANGWVDTVPEAQKRIVRSFNHLKELMTLGILGHHIGVALGDMSNVPVAVAAGHISALNAARVSGRVLSNDVRLDLDGWHDRLASESDVVKTRANHYVLMMRKAMMDPAKRSIPQRLADHANSPTVSAAADKYTDLHKSVMETAFIFQQIVDKRATIIIYEAAKLDAEQAGHSPDRAKALADAAVEAALPPLENMSKSMFLRNGTFMSSLLLFHGYFNQLGNIVRTEFHEEVAKPYYAAKAGKGDWGFGKTGNRDNFAQGVTKFTAETLAIFFMSNVLAEWLSGRGKDDRETILQYLTRKMVAAPFAVIPFGSAIGEGVGLKVSGSKIPPTTLSMISFRQAPQLALLENIGKLGANAMQKNRPLDKRVFDGIEALLYLQGLPARQWRRTGEYLWDAVGPSSRPLPVQDPADFASGVLYGRRKNQPNNLFRWKKMDR
jgi:hypothetical protein